MSQEDELHHVGLGDQLEDGGRSEVGVLNFAFLQIVPPNSYCAIPGTLEVKGQVHCFDASCHSLECKELVFALLPFVDLPVLFLLPGTRFFHDGPACFFESRLRK